jgi:ribA/ribD-fused uncharacterized protein
MQSSVMKYSIQWLHEQIKQDVSIKYLFFWGHTQKRPGTIDKSCFSQWYPTTFVADGKSYPSAEHWMMAQKAYLFGDTETVEKIFAVEKPAAAKALGREVKNFDAELWSKQSYDIVVRGNFHKFSQNVALKKYLLETGEMVIAEASPTDTIWGIGLSQDSTNAVNPVEWKGTNLLGFALMEARDLLK